MKSSSAKSNQAVTFAVIAIVVVGFLLSVLAAGAFRDIELSAAKARFDKKAEQKASALIREVQINFEALRSLSLIFRGQNTPSFEDFLRITEDTLIRFKDIQALEWIPRVEHSDRAVYTAEMQKRFPSYVFTERVEQGMMSEAKDRDVYYPVYYLAPISGNEAAFGFDLGSDALRLETLEAAKLAAKPAASGVIKLVQGEGEVNAFLALVPVYKELSVTSEARVKNLKGFVLGVYKISDIVDSVGLLVDVSGIKVEIYDSTDGDTLLYSSQGLPEQFSSDMYYESDLNNIWGRQWKLKVYADQDYINASKSFIPTVILFAVNLVSLALATIVYILMHRARVINNIVEAKTKELNAANDRLKALSKTDGLTGLYNRSYMDLHLRKEWHRALRNQTPLTFVMIDVDYFKQYNDCYGHLKGDECLKTVAAELQKFARREGDVAVRYGGEEFDLLLLNSFEVMESAEICRKAIADLAIVHERSAIEKHLTISIGLCTIIPQRDQTPEQLIAKSDAALYRAKEKGRNLVVEWQDNFASSSEKPI